MYDAGEKHPGRVTTLGGGIFLGICLHVCPRQGPSLLYIRGARVSVEGGWVFFDTSGAKVLGKKLWARVRELLLPPLANTALGALVILKGKQYNLLCGESLHYPSLDSPSVY